MSTLSPEEAHCSSSSSSPRRATAAATFSSSIGSPDSAIGTAASMESALGRTRRREEQKENHHTAPSLAAAGEKNTTVCCRKKLERVVKETELLIGSPSTSREELLAESRFAQFLRSNMDEEVEECRRYYLYDPLRHQYRLYYATEVRLRSDSNLGPVGLSDDEEQLEPPGMPLRRSRSSGKLQGPIRRRIPPGTDKQLVDQQALLWRSQPQQREKGQTTTVFPAEPAAERRRGTFERNSISRKPLHPADLTRRRQWSGGVRRAAETKQHELKQQRTTSGGQPRVIGPNGEWTPKSAKIEAQSAQLVTNRLLRDLLRPLRTVVATEQHRRRSWKEGGSRTTEGREGGM